MKRKRNPISRNHINLGIHRKFLREGLSNGQWITGCVVHPTNGKRSWIRVVHWTEEAMIKVTTHNGTVWTVMRSPDARVFLDDDGTVRVEGDAAVRLMDAGLMRLVVDDITVGDAEEAAEGILAKSPVAVKGVAVHLGSTKNPPIAVALK